MEWSLLETGNDSFFAWFTFPWAAPGILTKSMWTLRVLRCWNCERFWRQRCNIHQNTENEDNSCWHCQIFIKFHMLDGKTFKNRLMKHDSSQKGWHSLTGHTYATILTWDHSSNALKGKIQWKGHLAPLRTVRVWHHFGGHSAHACSDLSNTVCTFNY